MLHGRYPDRRRAELARARLAVVVPELDYLEDAGGWGTAPQITRIRRDDTSWLVESIDRDVLIAEANAS
jgi:hypothetical protein